MSMLKSRAVYAWAMVLGCLLNPAKVAAASFQTLYKFTVPTGVFPSSTVTPVDGALFGTTAGNNVNTDGSVYSIDPDGSNFQLLHSFSGGNDGQTPTGTLLSVGSTIYGTTYGGGSSGYGVLYKMQTDGTGFQVLHTFNPGPSYSDAYHPTSGVIDVNNMLYGTTLNGGATGAGAIYSIAPDGSNYHVLFSFNSATTGASPGSELLLVGSKLYGTAYNGGANGGGVVFQVNLDGSNYNVLHAFSDSVDGSGLGGLTYENGRLYGLTSFGGPQLGGVVFSLGLSGTGFQLLHSFAPSMSGNVGPVGSLATDGTNLFGAVQGSPHIDNGSLFSVGINGTNFATLHAFGLTDGANPSTGPTLIGSTLFGTTAHGGINFGGTVYSLAIPEPSTITLASISSLLLWAWRRGRHDNAPSGRTA